MERRRIDVADEADTNEIVEAALAAKRQGEAAAEAVAAKARDWPLAAVGIGIGSAALAGALIYASRNRKTK